MGVGRASGDAGGRNLRGRGVVVVDLASGGRTRDTEQEQRGDGDRRDAPPAGRLRLLSRPLGRFRLRRPFEGVVDRGEGFAAGDLHEGSGEERVGEVRVHGEHRAVEIGADHRSLDGALRAGSAVVALTARDGREPDASRTFRVPGSGFRFSALALAAGSEARLGQPVFTIGFPNPDVQGTEPKLTRGEISSLAGMKDDPRHFQISVPVQPGNSGGPLVDLNGNVVGIVSMR